MESKSLQENFTAFFSERRGAHAADPLGSCAQLRLIFFLLEQLIVQMKGQACAFPMFINHNNEPLLFFPPVHYIAIKRYRSAVSLGKHPQRRCGGGERYVYVCTHIYLRRTPWPRRKQMRDVRSEGFPSPAFPAHRRRKGALFPGALRERRRPELAEPGGRVLPPGVSAFLPVWVTFVGGGTPATSPRIQITSANSSHLPPHHKSTPEEIGWQLLRIHDITRFFCSHV